MSDAHGRTQDLDAWLFPFLAVLGCKTHRVWALLYLRGLLGPGERKSLQPMAARLKLADHAQLQHLIASTAWDDSPAWTALAHEADRLVSGPDIFFVIDDTALPKQGALSVGMARQYCGQLGKLANCQSLVSLTLAQDEVPVLVGLRLFLPEEWTGDTVRAARAGVPEETVAPRSKGEIALAELDRLLAAGVRFGTVLADAGYGTSAAFRQGLDMRHLRWAVGIARNQKVYGAGVQLMPPPGRDRRLVPDEEPRPADEVLAALPWRRVTWRHGTKGSLAARFAAVRVRVGDSPVWGNNPHLPGEEAWLVGKWRTSGERKYYLSNLGAKTSLRALAAAIKARWVCEQGRHQQLKGKLGLGHFEGRSWTGLHRHALMACITFAYLQHLRLVGHRRTGRGKNADPPVGSAPATQPACRTPCHRSPAVRAPREAGPMSALRAQVPARV